MYRVPALLYLLLAICLPLHAEQVPTYNRISFSVSAAAEVDSDLLVVRLFTQHEARQQADAANKVNADMAWALAQAKAVSVVKAQTLDYRTNPVYNDRKIRAWQTRQSLRLESADNAALTRLLGQLQTRLAIESVGYEISPAVRRDVEQRLTAEAIEQFSARAGRIAQSFGRGGYRLVNLNINSQGGQRPPVAFRGRAMSMQAEVADPSIAAGQQSIAVTLNGSIELSEP